MNLHESIKNRSENKNTRLPQFSLFFIHTQGCNYKEVVNYFMTLKSLTHRQRIKECSSSSSMREFFASAEKVKSTGRSNIYGTKAESFFSTVGNRNKANVGKRSTRSLLRVLTVLENRSAPKSVLLRVFILRTYYGVSYCEFRLYFHWFTI